MKLEINLADREEIAAAVPLLQLILTNTSAPVCSGACHKEVAAAPAPLAPPAPSTAGAEVPPIALEVPPATSPLPPAALVPPAPTPANAAPIAAPLPPSPAGSVDLDSRGLPWDDRIHASTKTKIANGQWKAKRGVDEATVTAVEQELRARLAVAVPTPAPAPATVGEAWPIPATDAAAVFGGGAVAPAPFVPPAAPSLPAPPAAPSELAAPATFEQLMPRISTAVVGGTLPATALNAACVSVGLPSVVALQTSPQNIPAVWEYLRQQYPALT